MNNLRSLATRVRRLTGRAPQTAGAVLVDAPLTDEQWQMMLDTEARLLADRAEGRPLTAMQADILEWMPVIRDARQRIADRESGKPFVPVYGIDVKAELESEAEEEGR
jgi:hypothetical protein